MSRYSLKLLISYWGKIQFYHLAILPNLYFGDVYYITIKIQNCDRKRTWFNAVSEIQWFDADSSNLLDQVWKLIIL
ncbi:MULTISPECIES: hypothetical protein [Planktothrix]|uniref:hypothetical protein n=1 Tax=Planktothrix TaxID=54304 RepID=UPI00047A9ECF|nr:MULTISPECIES: hypothetical protein [Planktothrix]